MSPLSNPVRTDNAVQYRKVRAHEINAGLRLLLSSNGRVSDDTIIEFIASSHQRGVDVASMQVAVRGDDVVWALLPIVSPGRTMLLLSPPHAPTRASGNAQAVLELTDFVCQTARTRDNIDLAQMLLDPAEISLTQLYLQSGFIDLAELIYLQRTVKRMIAVNPLHAGVRVEPYSAAFHGLFIDTIARSYVGSLDCPALNGLRDMEDVLIGHQHSGEFDPSIWFLLIADQTPLGVMLLSRSMRADSIELVYLGLVPEARGHHWADRLMQLALVTVLREKRSLLTLAVDSRNTPAIKLYQRHGLSRVGSRRALIRDLRS